MEKHGQSEEDHYYKKLHLDLVEALFCQCQDSANSDSGTDVNRPNSDLFLYLAFKLAFVFINM